MTCKHTIGTAVDEDGCCVSCGKDLNSLFEKHCGNCPIIAENAKLKDALEQIDRWCNAYPVDVFPPMQKTDWEQVHRVLKAAGMNLARVSADTMRHVLDGVTDIVRKGLED